MPGLYCPTSWTPLPLTDSCVRAYAKGPCLSLRARLTYHNPQPQPVEGVFVYPLAEAEVVSGFEAEAAGRRVSFQLHSRRRSQAACCRALGPGLGTSTPRRCAQGKLRPQPEPEPAPSNASSGSCTLVPPLTSPASFLLPDADFIFHPLVTPLSSSHGLGI
uniref:VIT domain-containing protein n=1 Tax=Mus musculus TaxID=10090 RepID=Q8C7Y8_MOUSE|nr:unnamed protein product [Mus musculus]